MKVGVRIGLYYLRFHRLARGARGVLGRGPNLGLRLLVRGVIYWHTLWPQEVSGIIPVLSKEDLGLDSHTCRVECNAKQAG